MRAQDLTLSEILQFDDHYVGLSGRRLVLHDMHAFAQFRKDIVDSVGLEQARRMFTRFGMFWGEADAAAMKRLFRWDSTEELLRAGPRLHSLQGVARTVIKKLSFEPDSGRLDMRIAWHDSGEAMEHLAELGPSRQPVCWILTGYASGYTSYCLGQPIYFLEQRCRGQGHRVCLAVGRDETSWGSGIGAQRSFFQADKIMEKVRRLTLEIQRKQRAFESATARLEQLEQPAPWAEVRSVAFRRVLELAARVAPYDSSILISGESGTGKEVLARFIHSRSRRADAGFLPINCASLPDSLLESELFGHKAGAFTGAVHDRVGLFEAAGRGTVFLDEIGDISPAMQAKLLRVVQEREVLRLGENRPRPISARIVSATHKNLTHQVHAGHFREDLFYRLRVVELCVPPLRERRDDILPLARSILKRHSERLSLATLRLDASALDALLDHGWPGNVRELENALERAAVLSENGVITRGCLPPEVLDRSVGGTSQAQALKSLDEVEREHIARVLLATNDNRTEAAEILGISQTTLWRRLKRQSGQT